MGLIVGQILQVKDSEFEDMITENNQNETPREKIIFKKVKKKICEHFKWLNMWITRNNEKGERKYLKK